MLHGSTSSILDGKTPLILTSVFEAGHNHLRNNKDVGLFITSKIKYVVVQIYVLFRKEWKRAISKAQKLLWNKHAKG